MDSNQDKCGFVNIIGATNVGKSTLLNKLVGQKISIISRKVLPTAFKLYPFFPINIFFCPNL